MKGVKEDILSRIQALGRGSIFLLSDFSDYPEQMILRYNIAELAKEGSIIRLARGVYCYPVIDDRGGYGMKTVYPSDERIALTIAEKTGVRIIPYGDRDAFDLGLSSMWATLGRWLTDGAPRKINLTGGKTIHFIHTSDVYMFAFRNLTMRRLCGAIRNMGEDWLEENPERLRRVRLLLDEVPVDDFNHDIKLPPAWVKRILLRQWNP